MKVSKSEYLIWCIFFVVGLIFSIIGVLVCTNTFNYVNKIDTVGIISEITTYRGVDGDRAYNVYVTYNVNGREYNSRLNTYASNFYEGKEIDIYYDKDNPYEIGSKSLDYIFLVFPALGLIFLVMGGIGIYVKVNKKNRYKKLKAYGEKIDAIYTKTIVNIGYTVNRMHPYNIICEWVNPVDNQKYTFKSENIWTNPESIIAEKNIKTFPVYLDRKNKTKYIIDIDIIRNNIEDSK